jgi:hypothetical protein
MRAAVLAAGLLLPAVLPSLSFAYGEFVEKARPFGARDCLFCHSMPRGMTGWNKRGQWLISEKTRRGAERVDVAWLSAYQDVKGKSHGKSWKPPRRTKRAGPGATATPTPQAPAPPPEATPAQPAPAPQ